MTKLSAAALLSGMAMHTGTTSWTRHSLMRRLLLTEGVMWLQEHAECYWLVDAIASHLATNPRLQREEFQTWNFTRGVDDIAAANDPHRLTVTNGNSKRPIVTQELTYTDFPLPTIRFFAARDDSLPGWVLMLPGEY